MPYSHATYTDISVSALSSNHRSHDVIEKKKEIISSIASHYGKKPESVLFFGFSALVFGLNNQKIYLTAITDNTKKFLDEKEVKYTYIDQDDLPNYEKAFDWVIAGDEFFTFAHSEDDQKNLISLLGKLTKSLIVTTLKDYKNQDFKDREFSQPLAIRGNEQSTLFIEYHDYDYSEKNAWKTTVYELLGKEAKYYGPFSRRSMYFKQMAKFSIDAGAKQFFVHKNLMYKSLIKKNYEHVITISF